MRGFARWIAESAGDDPLLDRHAEWRDARGSGLVAQQPGDTVGHEPLLPAPNCGLGGSGPAHDFLGAAALRRQQDDLGSPDMLLWRVPVRRDRRQTLAIGGAQVDCDAGAHAADWHSRIRAGNSHKIQPSDFIH